MSANNTPPYNPQPFDISDVSLSDDLLQLTERIAENTHDTWARTRLDQGWRKGDERNDKTKEHPNLVPYEELTEEEKDYDRIIAMNTLRLVKKLGFDIVKRPESNS